MTKNKHAVALGKKSWKKRKNSQDKQYFSDISKKRWAKKDPVDNRTLA